MPFYLPKGVGYDRSHLFGDYFASAFATPQRILQLSFVIALMVALAVMLFFAIAKPFKRRKHREEKIHDIHEKLVAIKNQILSIDDELRLIDENVEKTEKNVQIQINDLIENERRLYEEELLFSNGKDKIAELEEKQKIFAELQRKQQYGMLLSMKSARQSKGAKGANSKRADFLEKNIADVSRDFENFKSEQKRKKEELIAKCESLEYDLDKLLLADVKVRKLKNASVGAKAEMAKLRAYREAEIKAIESLRIAKEEYESAYLKRIQTEHNRKIALDNIRREEDNKKKIAELVKQSERSSGGQVANAVEFEPQDPREVQLIISDVNDEGIPVLTETPVSEKTDTENFTELAGQNGVITDADTERNEERPFEQLSMIDSLDEVVFTHADAYADETLEEIALADVTYSPSSDENTAETAQPITEKANSVDNSAFIDGFSPKEPEALWKIARPDLDFIAYLTVRGRKIAKTNPMPAITDVKKTIRQTCFAISRKRITYVSENGKYYFTVNTKSGKVLLTGEKQYSADACRLDAESLPDICKCEIKEL